MPVIATVDRRQGAQCEAWLVAPVEACSLKFTKSAAVRNRDTSSLTFGFYSHSNDKIQKIDHLYVPFLNDHCNFSQESSSLNVSNIKADHTFSYSMLH